MKNILLTAFAICIAYFLQAQQAPTKEQQLVQQTVLKLFEALSNADSANFKKLSTANISFYEYGQIWNSDTLMNKTKASKSIADYQRVDTFDFINTEVSKNFAWVSYKLYSTVTKEKKQIMLEWLETIVLTKQHNQWKVRHLHSTLIKRT